MSVTIEAEHDAYDVVVIGSGLGGLTAGAMLAKDGRRVLVVERYTRPGGYAHSFSRGGDIFDSAIHLLPGGARADLGFPGPLQMLTAALLAIPLKKNLPVALLTTLYTNPFTIAPLYVLAYAYGNLLLGGSAAEMPPGPYDVDWALSLGRPLVVGLLALATTLSAAGYLAVQIAWRAYVAIAWRARRRRREKEKREVD